MSRYGWKDVVARPSGKSRRDKLPSGSQEPEDDVLLVKHKGITYPLYFPAYSIGDDKLAVTDLKARLGIIMELTESQVRNITLLYKGKQLYHLENPVREYGVKNRNEVLSFIPQPRPSVEFPKHTRKEEGSQNFHDDKDAPTWPVPIMKQVHDATYDSDNESTTSVASSLFSNASSSSASSVGSVEHRKEVSKQLVEMLLSRGMRATYHNAINKLGEEYLLKIYNRILSRYLNRPRDSTQDSGILLIIRTLSSRSQKSRASQLIIRALSRNALAISNVDREKRLNERLKIASRANRTSDDQDETSEEEVDENDGSLKYLHLVVAFFQESPHFQELISELRSITNLPSLPQTISEAIDHNDPLFIAILLDT
ncbi:hypothetical protein V2G26_001665 [Clonostachys chloroleuca]